MSSLDVAAWLAERSTFEPNIDGLDLDLEPAMATLGPRELAASLCDFAAAGTGKPAALALEAIADAVWWTAQLREDSASSQPRVAGGADWLEAFTTAVLAQPDAIARSALAFVPPLPLGEQHYVDGRSDAYLSRSREPGLDRVGDVADAVLNGVGKERSRETAERIWWAVNGGTAGAASRLVRSAEIAAFHPRDQQRRPAVVELRARLVATTHDALVAGVPFWARAWLVEHVACLDRRLLEDLIVHEQEPWLAHQMRFVLSLTPTQRHERALAWLS